MSRGKLWKLLLKRFKGALLLLLGLTFLISYLPFLIRFNLRNNLYKWEYRGKFDYLWGQFSVTKQIVNGKVYVDWTKLLLILVLLYFPLKIAFHWALNYWQKHYQRQAQVYLTKKLLNFAAKNQDLMTRKTSEKVYILNQVVPEFSRQFFTIPLKWFEIVVDLGLEIFALFFLIKSSNLKEMVPLIMAFLLVNLIWLALFYYFFGRQRKLNQQKEWNYQEEEKKQIKIFCENLNSPLNLEKVYNLLDKNSARMAPTFLLSRLTELPDLIIPGMAVLFLALYYQIWLGGSGDLGWNAYFLAYNLQRILGGGKKMFAGLAQTASWRENYRQIEQFFV